MSEERRELYVFLREHLAAIRRALEQPPSLEVRGQIRVGEFLIQKWPALRAGGESLLAIVVRDGERRVIREESLEASIRALLAGS